MRFLNKTKQDSNQQAFMMPMVILMMGIMMIVGTAALSQASNSFNLGIRQNFTTIALQAAESAVEYSSVRYKNSCSNWWPNGNFEGPYINDPALNYRVTIINAPKDPSGNAMTVNVTNSCGNYDADITAKVYVPASSTTAKYSKTLKTSFSRTGSASASSTYGGGAGVNINAQLNTFIISGHVFVFGVIGNSKAAYGQNTGYLICLDQSKTYSVNNDSQACDGSGNGTATLAANTYIDSNMLNTNNLTSPATGIGGSFSATGSGTGSNLFMVDGSSYFDKAADGSNGNFYFSVQRTPPSGTSPTAANTDAGWACVNFSVSGIKNCGFRKVGNIAPAFTSTAASVPQWMFTATTYKDGKLYGISGKEKTPNQKDRIYCWNITQNAVCSGQPYKSNLPDYLPDQHQFFYFGPYGFYAWGSPYPSDITPTNSNSSKIYWTGNYSTFSNPWWLSAWGGGWPWYQLHNFGSQHDLGSMIDCFDTTLATPGPCFNSVDSLNFLNGQNTLPFSNSQSTIVGWITYQLTAGADYWDYYGLMYSYGNLGFTASPFFQRNTTGTPNGLCQSTQQDHIMHNIGRVALKCYNLTSGQSQTVPAGLDPPIHYDYTVGISAETKDKIYTPYTINDALLVSQNLDWTKNGDTINWSPAILRSRGFCYDWTTQSVCSGWGGGTGIVTWAGPPVPPTLNLNANPGVFSFTADGGCLNASSVYGASLFTVYQSNGTYGCSASSFTRGIIR